jgi:hypothetical protein
MKASLEPLLDALNKPTVKLGIEYRYILFRPQQRFWCSF